MQLLARSVAHLFLRRNVLCWNHISATKSRLSLLFLNGGINAVLLSVTLNDDKRVAQPHFHDTSVFPFLLKKIQSGINRESFQWAELVKVWLSIHCH